LRSLILAGVFRQRDRRQGHRRFGQGGGATNRPQAGHLALSPAWTENLFWHAGQAKVIMGASVSGPTAGRGGVHTENILASGILL